MTANYLSRTREHTPANSAKKVLRKTRGNSGLSTRAYDGKSVGQTMDPRYYPRSTSPGARKLVTPGRSSTGNFGGQSSYDPPSNSYSRSPRDDYASAPRTTMDRFGGGGGGGGGGGVIPISTEVYTNYAPSSSSTSASRHPYSGRARRSTLMEVEPIIRSRPSSVVPASTTTVIRPSSPLTRYDSREAYEPRDVYIKSSATPRREHKKTMYSVDNGSAKLIAETEPARASRDYSEAVRKERGGYHLSGAISRPREVDDASFSYTTPAAMYQETEPRWRARRGSVDAGNRRPSSVVDSFGPTARVRDFDHRPPASTRGFDKVNDFARAPSLREPVRSASRERPSTFDPYRSNGNYDKVPLRSSSTMPIVVTQARDPRDDRYYNDDYDDRRDLRQRSKPIDDGVETRGFGLRRSSSVDRYAPPPPPIGEYSAPRGAQPSKPVMSKPALSKPSMNQPLMNHSSFNHSSMNQPSMHQPSMNQPSASKPPVSKPSISKPAAAMFAAAPIAAMASTNDYSSRPVVDERRSSTGPSVFSAASGKEYAPRGVAEPERRGPDPSLTKEHLPRPAETLASRPAELDRRESAAHPSKEYPFRPGDERRPSAAPQSKEHPARSMDDDRRSSAAPHPKEYPNRPMEDDRRSTAAPPSKEYLNRPSDDDRRNTSSYQPQDYHSRPAENGRRDRERDRPAERDYERTQDRNYERRERSRDRGRDQPRRDSDEKDKDKEKSRSSLLGPAAAAAGVAAAAGIALNKRSQDKKQEVEDKKQEAEDKKQEAEEGRERNRRVPRQEPNASEDEREQRYAERDRIRDEERKRDGRKREETVDPDEDYRRRVQQQEVELSALSRQGSRDDERSDSDRERRRRDRHDREERDRREKRKDSADEVTNLETQASQQHNRYDHRHSSNELVPVSDNSDTPRALPAITSAPAQEGSSHGEPTAPSERRVTIVEPSKNQPEPELAVKGILRKPTEKFPEHPNPVREGVAPLKEKLEKDQRAKDIPSGAKWTKIDRRLVNPESLKEKGERYEERMDCVIVLRVLTKKEIQGFADRTKEIRDERDNSERSTSDKARHSKHHDNDDEDSDSDRERRHRRDREKRREKERDAAKDRDRDRDSHRDADRERRREPEDDYRSEEESLRKAIDDGRSSRNNRNSRKDREEEYSTSTIAR